MPLIIVKENLGRIGGRNRWIPTHIQLANALTKGNPEAMDILRAALITNSLSCMLKAKAWKQLQSREGPAWPAVFLVRDGNSQAEMVKVPVKNLKEHEVRALFEVMVSNTVKNADEIR